MFQIHLAVHYKNKYEPNFLYEIFIGFYLVLICSCQSLISQTVFVYLGYVWPGPGVMKSLAVDCTEIFLEQNHRCWLALYFKNVECV